MPINWKQMLGYAIGGAGATLGGGTPSDFFKLMEVKKQREQQVKSKFLSDFMTVLQLPPGSFRVEGLKAISKNYQDITGQPIAKGFMSIIGKLDGEYSNNLQLAIKDAMTSGKPEDMDKALAIAGRGAPGDISYVYKAIQYGAQLKQQQAAIADKAAKEKGLIKLSGISGNDAKAIGEKLTIALKSGNTKMAMVYQKELDKMRTPDSIFNITTLKDPKTGKSAKFALTKSGKLLFLGNNPSKEHKVSSWDVAQQAAGFGGIPLTKLTSKQADLVGKKYKEYTKVSSIFDSMFEGLTPKQKIDMFSGSKKKETTGLIQKIWSIVSNAGGSTAPVKSTAPAGSAEDEFNKNAKQVRKNAQGILLQPSQKLSPKERGKKIQELKKQLRSAKTIEERKRLANEIDRLRRQ